MFIPIMEILEFLSRMVLPSLWLNEEFQNTEPRAVGILKVYKNKIKCKDQYKERIGSGIWRQQKDPVWTSSQRLHMSVLQIIL